MLNHDLEMLTYLKLAELSQRKQNVLGCDKMLVLAGAAACEAGCLLVAERCREVLVRHQPRHQLARYVSFADALRSDEFAPLLKRLRKLCSFEQAEFLAREWDLADEADTEVSAAEIEAAAMKLLAAICIEA